MKKSSIVWLVVVIVIVIAGIWYWSAMQSSSGYPSVVAPLSATQSPASVVAIDTTSTTKLGTFLVAPNGMTLYTYSEDSPGVSTCTSQCATIWPPYTVPDSESSSTLVGVTGAGGDVGILTRADGSYQVTYNGTPLYFYSKDKVAGDTMGQGVGGVWFVANP